MRKICYSLFFLLSLTLQLKAQKKIQHPLLPGYFADPTVVENKGSYFIYATIDPWGGKELAVFETRDFINFTRHHLNWPTKDLCTSATSNNSMVWAPSVVKGKDNKFYMYVSVGSEVWAGVSNAPLGPWKNIKTDNSPLIGAKDFPKVHNIDADCFLDDDGQAYLYWGSGFDWINGKCMAVKLKSDMHTFLGKPVEVTPPGYFEGPHIIKRNGRYLLMFSEGKAIDETYKVGYSIEKLHSVPLKKARTADTGHHSKYQNHWARTPQCIKI